MPLNRSTSWRTVEENGVGAGFCVQCRQLGSEVGGGHRQPGCDDSRRGRPRGYRGLHCFHRQGGYQPVPCWHAGGETSSHNGARDTGLDPFLPACWKACSQKAKSGASRGSGSAYLMEQHQPWRITTVVRKRATVFEQLCVARTLLLRIEG